MVNTFQRRETCFWLCGVRREIAKRGSAFLHEKSYPRVGFPPFFSPRIGSPHHRRPLLSYAFLATGKDGFSSLDGYDFS